MTSQEKRERTNLSSEYFVMSALYRYGLNPSLTLGNKKSVDILLQKRNVIITIDVKGLRSKTAWLLGKNFKSYFRNHFLILVTYLNNFDNTTDTPECWIIPALQLKKFAKSTKKGLVINYADLIKYKKKYYERWELLKK
jgi:hypothetical protein